MSAASERAALLCDLEERLLSSSGRASPRIIGELLADDFQEFGSSGGISNKRDALKFLPEESRDGHRYEYVTADWQVRDLAEGVALVTYRVTRRDLTTGSALTSLRSSIWQHRDGRWQMVFHQGTRVPASSAR
jgi:hypothetical protein